MPNCVNLNLNIHPLREGIDINSYGTTKHIIVSVNDINHDLMSFLNTLNLTVKFVELFYTPPYFFSKIHTDNLGGDYVKLNYIFGGKDSFMFWWKPKLDTSTQPVKTSINSLYIGYHETDVDLVDKQQVKFPSIVQVGVPHNIENFEEPRYCLSLVLRKQDDNTRLTMAESIEIFKGYLQ